ncbi:MAG: protein O-mannosyl-transferase family, partial [Candidatus Promineifilaceae bacterium]
MRKYLRPELLLLLIPIFYVATLARSLVLGDPTEYTYVANVLGIAHPPGYAFITLLGKLFQTIMPFGEIPWRMHLLSAVTAT